MSLMTADLNLDSLNPEQLEAVIYPAGPLLTRYRNESWEGRARDHQTEA